jgi:hypothetical protein
MAYSIRYDLVDGLKLKPQTDYVAGRAAVQNLSMAILAHAWSPLLGPDFVRVCVAEIWREAPSAFRFEFEGERPAAAGVLTLIARIDHIVDDMRKPDRDSGQQR